jgi:hypothetical protein
VSAQTAVDETSRFEQLVADLKIPSGDFTGVPQQLADAIAQAGLEASTGTIAFARKQPSGDYPGEFSDQNGGLSHCWPQWAFDLAKAALLSQQCSAAEALQAVTRSGGRGDVEPETDRAPTSATSRHGHRSAPVEEGVLTPSAVIRAVNLRPVAVCERQLAS